MSDVAIDLFAGPGGWSQAARALRIRELGIEMDAAACATRAAAGHPTIRANVAELPLERLAGRARGLIASPPCTTFSAAGDGAGNAVTDQLAQLTWDMFAGRDTRDAHRQAIVAQLAESSWRAELPAEDRAPKIERAAASAVLVAEPARFIAACRPEWIALEQVPAVLPLWQVYADALRRMGYSAWCGKLNAADYGVPQTRERAILIASRSRRVSRPESTHYDPRKGLQLWGDPWVSMAEALGWVLGWGATGRPSVSVTAGGTSTGGAEPFGHRGRDALEAEQDAGRWALRRSRGEGMLVREGRGGRRDHPLDEPAPTITSAGSKVGANLTWVLDRPATTVQGDPRIGRPGHKDREGGESQFDVDSVRITVEEAAILQSFPPDYPWRGTRTKQFEQCGNAVPVLLALHVLSMATGIPLPQSATEAAA